MTHEPLHEGTCAKPDLNDLIGPYCFEDLAEEERGKVEAHLLACDACWDEVCRLEASVRLLRTDRQLFRTVLSRDALGLFGLSARLSDSLGGHLRHVVVSCSLYGLWYPLALLSEIAYRFDAFRQLAWITVPALFAWTALTAFGAMTLDWRRAASGRHASAGGPMALLVAAAAAAVGTAAWWLPSEPIAQMQVQAYAAQAGFVKTSLLYGLPLALIFVFAPFHTIIALQRELKAGRHRLVLALLRGDPDGLAPRGAFFIRTRTLWVLLGGAAILGVAMTAHLVDNLQTGPYMNLFILLLEARFVLWFGTAAMCILWYQQCLNELKRECLAVVAAEGGDSSA